MGNYNSYQPQILGQEWVPIRDENLLFSPATNTVEVGHGFTLASSTQLGTGRFYINEFPPGRSLGQVYFLSVYGAGSEDQTGPIKRLIIPCSAALVSGGASVAGSATTAVEALADPSDNKWVDFPITGTPAISCFFAVNQYLQILGGKRIVSTAALYSMSALTVPERADRGTFSIQNSAGNSIGYGVPEIFGSTVETVAISRANLGEVDHFFGTAPTGDSERVPWRYEGLTRFEISTGFSTRLNFHYTHNTAANTFLKYVALEVLYCEEQRLVVGGRSFGEQAFIAASRPYVLGTNIVTMRTMAQATNPVLAAGNYSLVVESADLGDAAEPLVATPFNESRYPNLNAVRQLYAIPAHPGVQVNIPFPAADHVGDTFTSTGTMVLPQLSLHATGGAPVTAVHAYGRQIAAQVYGANTAIQEIYDDITGTAADYPQVRFYARRFGDTTIPLRLTGVGGLSGSTVSITPDEFDALTDIIDGWKEVTLRFTTVPSMGAVAGNPAWTWSATGELSGHRWEILGACAPAVSGIPGNLLNYVPTAERLGTATYQPPAGDTTELTWMPQGCGSPYVSGATADPNVDAVLIFSQDPNPVTGVALSQLTQTVTGIGFDCGSLPCCIPSGIGYNRVTWGLPVNTGVAFDQFDRVVAAGGWGTATDGKAWSTSGTASSFSVDGVEGVIAPAATGSQRIATLDAGGPDMDVTVKIKINDLAESGSLVAGAVARYTDASNFYVARLVYTTTAVQLVLRKRVAAANTDLVTITVPNLLPNVDAWRYVRIQVIGTTILAKVWGVDDTEPDWMIVTNDTSLTTGSRGGVFVQDDTGAAAPSNFLFQNFTINPPDYFFGGLELQRLDTVDYTWQTIMLATSPTVTGFSDFEARVGINSVYRIRNLNVYNFAGPWSTQVTGAPPTPGVTGGCADMTGALIFTSNADQSGHSNAAYVMQWEGTPDETFDLPEADEVQFQPMYGRDGRVAFHGTERGLESFSRTLLIQAAAIDPVRLADVKTLRDLAWADLPYICVRDDIGDRWYSNVRVPTVNARHNRTKYMARISVVETTTQPFPVDP